MKKYTIAKLALSSLIALSLLSSCFDDKGNYDYKTKEPTTISGIGDYSRVLGRDTISIKPRIMKYVAEQGQNVVADPADYDFEWIWQNAVVDRVSYPAYVISTEPELLQHRLNMPYGNTYSFYLKIKEKQTGIEYFSNTFRVSIESSISRGYMLMCDVNDETRLDYVTFFGDMLIPIPDILAHAGVENVPFMGKPSSLALFYDRNSPVNGFSPPAEGYCVGVMTEHAAFRLDFETLEYDPLYDMKNWFSMQPELGFHPTVMYWIAGNIWHGDFLAYDKLSGNLYRSSGQHVQPWAPANYANKINGVRFNTSPLARPIIVNNAILFNDDTKSFVKMSGGVSNYYGVAELNNTGLDLVAINDRVSNTGVREIAAIMREPGQGKFWLYRFDYSSGNITTIRQLNLPDESSATDFCIPAFERLAFMYYRTDTKLYTIPFGTMEATEVYEAPEGHRISLAKFMTNTPGNEPDAIRDWQDKLALCTYDTASPAESCGTFGLYDTKDGDGNIEVMTYNGEQMRWSGFGKIVDIAPKHK